MSAYKQYCVRLFFAGNIPPQQFTVYGLDAENALKIAKYDARSLGYNIKLLTGHTVEVL